MYSVCSRIQPMPLSFISTCYPNLGFILASLVNPLFANAKYCSGIIFWQCYQLFYRLCLSPPLCYQHLVWSPHLVQLIKLVTFIVIKVHWNFFHYFQGCFSLPIIIFSMYDYLWPLQHLQHLILQDNMLLLHTWVHHLLASLTPTILALGF